MNIDADLENADWLRTRSWDLPTTFDDFLVSIGGVERLEHFLTLPAAEQMPADMRVAAEALVSRSKQLDVLEAMLKYSEDQPRDDHGRWTDGGSAEPTLTTEVVDTSGKPPEDDPFSHAGTPEDPIPCKDNIALAARLISEGVHVSLAQPDQVATLLDEVRDLVEQAKASGDPEKTYDMCNVSVEGTNLFCQDNLGIPRVQMPQLAGVPVPGSPADQMVKDPKGEVNLSGAFAEYLSSTGRDVVDINVDASHLRASQEDLVGIKVAGITDAIEAGTFDPKNGTIWVTNDNYVIDGHHRWAAEVAYEYESGKPLDIPVRMIDIDIGEALTLANFWTQEMGIAPKAAKSMQFSKMLTFLEDLLAFMHKEFDEDLHPRDEHGRFAPKEGADTAPSVATGTPTLATTEKDLEVTWYAGRAKFDGWLVSHAGELPEQSPKEGYGTFHFEFAHPEDATPEQISSCQDQIDRLMSDESMKPLFDVFGVPEFAIATALVGNDVSSAGLDPAGEGVVDAWQQGMIVMYADTAGDPSWDVDSDAARSNWETDREPPSTTSLLRDGGALIHEYGHQASILAAAVDMGEMERFIDAGSRGDYSSKADNIDAAAVGISSYAREGGPWEAWSECFTVVTDPNYDPGAYDSDAHRLLDYVERQVERWKTEGVG